MPTICISAPAGFRKRASHAAKLFCRVSPARRQASGSFQPSKDRNAEESGQCAYNEHSALDARNDTGLQKVTEQNTNQSGEHISDG
jgi:hypothetical protein